MNAAKKVTWIALACALVAAGLCGCDKTGDTPGEKLDRVLDKTGDKVIDVGDAIKPR